MFWKLKALDKDKKIIWRTYNYRSAAEVRAICRKSGWIPISMVSTFW